MSNSIALIFSDLAWSKGKGQGWSNLKMLGRVAIFGARGCGMAGERRARRSSMIPRYTRAEMAAIWSPESRFRIWFEIEAHATDAMAELGIVPKTAARVLWDKAGSISFDPERIDAIEREVKH